MERAPTCIRKEKGHLSQVKRGHFFSKRGHLWGYLTILDKCVGALHPIFPLPGAPPWVKINSSTQVNSIVIFAWFLGILRAYITECQHHFCPLNIYGANFGFFQESKIICLYAKYTKLKESHTHVFLLQQSYCQSLSQHRPVAEALIALTIITPPDPAAVKILSTRQAIIQTNRILKRGKKYRY